VLLVDADMRSPSLHHLFGMQNDTGLSNYLSGGAQIGEIARRAESDGLSVVFAGPAPPNAAELLTGSRIEAFMREAAGIYEHVIFDVPPVMGLADTPLIASQVEGVVFVIESHATPIAMARVAIGRLEGAQARVLGAVLTKFETKRAHYGYGYDYGYGYGENARSET
jgi:capsular exopolysaccharide synthesis family protein